MDVRPDTPQAAQLPHGRATPSPGTPQTEGEGRSESVTVLGPRDVVLLVAQNPLDMETAERIREQWRDLPQRVLVVDSSFKVIVRRPRLFRRSNR